MTWATRILCSVSVLAIGWPAVAHAQDAAEPAPAQVDPAAPDDEDIIVVSGIRASLSQAAEIKRNSDVVVDSIVAEDIGKFPDTTTAAALQRVPGVQVVNGFNNEIVNPLIRGIGDIITTLDGREIFTGVGRGFAFQDLPAEALARADVYKSNSAEKIEGGVAGNINLRLRKPFDLDDGLTVSALGRATYGETADEFSYNGGVLIGGRWAAGDGEMGALVNVSYSDNSFNRPISFNCDPRSGTNGPPGGAGVVLPTCVGGLTDTGKYQRPQVNAAFQWRPNETVEVYLDGLYSGYRSKFGTFFIFSDIFAAQSITNAEATDICFQAPVNGAGFRDPRSTTIQNLCMGSSATFNNVPGNTSTQAKEDKTDQYLFAGGIKITDGPWNLRLDLSRFQSKTDLRTTIVDIGKRIAQVNVDINDNQHGTTDMVGNPVGDPAGFMFINSLFQDYRGANSTIEQMMFDGSYDVGSFLDQIQFGVRYADRKATFRGNAAGGPPASNMADRLVANSGLPSGFLIESPATIPVINGGQHWITPDPDFLRNNTDVLRALYGAPAGDPPDSPTRSFDADETTLALYLQGRYAFDVGTIPVDGLIGGRYVMTDRIILGTGVVTPPGGVGVLTPVKASSSSSKFLPNASIRVQLTPELQVRASYARTISQPAFADLNPGLTYSIPSNANIRPNGTGGNPNLRPQIADSYDATIEYYFGRGSYIAAGVYHRDIKDRVARNVAPEVIDGIEYDINRPRNLGSSKLQGFEVGGQYFFDFLPEGLDGLGAFANFTYADTEVLTEGDLLQGEPLGGVSKYAYNVGALYEKYGFHARVVYNWRDRYYDGTFTQLLVPEQQIYFNYVRPNGRLDFSVGYDVTENITVNFEGVNVLGGKYLSYFDIPEFPHDIRIDDTFYGASVRVKF